MTIHDVHGTPVTLTTHGEGRPVLLLHGGGGPQTVDPWAQRLASTHHVRVLVPTHPGFAGTARPQALDDIPGLARLYADLLDVLDLRDVTVVGNSIGGWVAAELAVLAPARVGRYVLVDAVGLEVEGHPLADFFSLAPAEVAALSYADPARYGLDPAALPEGARAALAANRTTLETYAGRAMADPTLRDRLGAVAAPVLVVWGEADRICDAAHGAAYASAIPGARLVTITDAGHLPQVEQPDALAELVAGLLAPLPVCPA